MTPPCAERPSTAQVVDLDVDVPPRVVEEPSGASGSGESKQEGEGEEEVRDDDAERPVDEIEVLEIFEDLEPVVPVPISTLDSMSGVWHGFFGAREQAGDDAAGGASRSYVAPPRASDGFQSSPLHDIATSKTLETIHLNVNMLPAGGKEARALLSSLMSDPALQMLEIEGEWKSAGSFMAEGLWKVIRCAPKLEELHLLRLGELDAQDVKGWADALVNCTRSLKVLVLGELEEGHMQFLMMAFTGEFCNQTIRTLYFYAQSGCIPESFEDRLPKLVSANRSLKRICIDEWTLEQTSVGLWDDVGHSLHSNTFIEYLEIVISTKRQLEEKARALLTAANQKSKPVIKILIPLKSRHWANEASWKSLAKLLAECNSVKSLRLHFLRPMSIHSRILDVLRDNLSTLQELELVDVRDQDAGSWKRFFHSLRYNTSLTHMRFRNIVGLDDESFRELMELLKANSTLRTIDCDGTKWKADGKGALIDELLRNNVQRESYLSVLKKAKLKFDDARAARLLLCGSSNAGKTRLKTTMMRARNKRWLETDNYKTCKTLGIEVEFLQNDEDMQIAIWDLAGQKKFRIVQEVLFPKADQPCIFLFVFSPFNNVKKNATSDPQGQLRAELQEWLRFVASNSCNGTVLPRMMVVFTHQDKVKKPTTEWALTIVQEMQEEFRGLVDLIIDPIFYINANKKKHVLPLLDKILTSFKDLLHERSDIVPQICSQLTSILACPGDNIQSNPIWSRETFYEFCFKRVEPFNFFRKINPPTREIWDAIASYLHDVGSIILISEADLVVVYPNWLSRHFLGSLIKLGHSLPANRKAYHALTRTASLRSCNLAERDLETLLHSFISKPSCISCFNGFENLETLKLLLLRLGLCYRTVDGGEPHVARYFMPSIVQEGPQPNTNLLRWEAEAKDEDLHNYIGFRLLCKDFRRTSLTSTLFTRLQIDLRNKLTANSTFTAEVKSYQGYSKFFIDGHEIILEKSVDGSHVDTLIRGSRMKKRKETVQFIMKHIIDEIQAFCASPQGCPGVNFALSVLSSRSVQLLIPCEHRNDKHVIPVDLLRQHLQRNAEAQLEEDDFADERTLLRYEHVWPEVADLNLPRYSQPAEDLLPNWESEVASILGDIKGRWMKRLQNLGRIMAEMRAEVDHYKDERTAQGLLALMVGEASSACESIPHPPTASPSATLACERQIQQPELLLLDKLHDFKPEAILGNTFSGDRGVPTSEETLHDIIRMQHTLNSNLITFQSTIEELTGYFQSLEQARTPKFPFLSSKGEIFLHGMHRFGATHIGTPVRLHFMCESMPKPHAVEGQRGLEMVVEMKNFEYLRKLSIISTKIVCYNLKAGLKIYVRSRPRVSRTSTDLTTFENRMPSFINKVLEEDFRLDEQITSLEKTEVWLWLRDLLESELKQSYANPFNLYRVRYSKPNNGGCAWLCDKCMFREIREGKLDPFPMG